MFSRACRDDLLRVARWYTGVTQATSADDDYRCREGLPVLSFGFFGALRFAAFEEDARLRRKYAQVQLYRRLRARHARDIVIDCRWARDDIMRH